MTSGLSANGWTPSSALHVRRKKEIALFFERVPAPALSGVDCNRYQSKTWLDAAELLPGCGAEGYDRLGVRDTVNVAIEQAADQELKLLQRRAMAPTWSVSSDKVQSDSERSSMLQECNMSDRAGSHRLINPHPQSGRGIKKKKKTEPFQFEAMLLFGCSAVCQSVWDSLMLARLHHLESFPCEPTREVISLHRADTDNIMKLL